MKVINLISGPRNISTALMYAFAQRDDCSVMDEPFYGYYLATVSSRAVHPSEAEIMAAMPLSWSRIVKNIDQKASGSHVFVKGMAHHLVMEDLSFLLDWENIFLVRKPADLIVSFSKVIADPSLDDIGYRQAIKLMAFLEEAGRPFIVLESDELLKDPANYLAQICNWLDIPFSADMLKWPPGPIPEDGLWARHWYASVHASSGFESRPPSPQMVPERLGRLLSEANDLYDQIDPYILKNKSHVTEI